MSVRAESSRHSATVGLLQAAEQVRNFHQKHGFDCEVGFSSRALSRDSQLEVTGQALIAMSAELETAYMQTRDPRLLRAHLMLEELGETLAAMAFADVDGFYDGLADLIYVALGSAVTVGPRYALAFVFDEVHRSNMTKEAKAELASRHDDPRLRRKGKSYVPPRINAAINLALARGDPSLMQWRVLDQKPADSIVIVETMRLDGSRDAVKMILRSMELDAFRRLMSMLNIREQMGAEGDGS